MKKIMATIALIMALSITAFAGHHKRAQPGGSESAPSPNIAVSVCAELGGHNN